MTLNNSSLFSCVCRHNDFLNKRVRLTNMHNDPFLHFCTSFLGKHAITWHHLNVVGGSLFSKECF